MPTWCISIVALPFERSALFTLYLYGTVGAVSISTFAYVVHTFF